MTRNNIPATLSGGDPIVMIEAPSYVDALVHRREERARKTEPVPTVGPTLEFKRGQTSGVMLFNNIEVCGSANHISNAKASSGWTPHGYDVTNLHTHGLHVSPRAPSDNVLLTVFSQRYLDLCKRTGKDPLDEAHSSAIFMPDQDGNPTSFFPYRYEVPSDHPVGLFWYHPHKHGSVASQVAPGMAGALVIRENNPDDKDIDSCLASPPYNIGPDHEDILVLQTLKASKITNPELDGVQGVFWADGYYGEKTFKKPPEPSTCYGYSVALDDGNAEALDLAVTVNGRYNPDIDVKYNEIRRLRILNAASGATIIPEFVDAEGKRADVTVCAIAVDGITLEPTETMVKTAPDALFYEIDFDIPASQTSAKYWTTAELLTIAPGQRVELLVRVNQSKGAPASQTITMRGATPGSSTGLPPNVIETVKSDGDPDPDAYQGGDLVTFNVTQGTRNPDNPFNQHFPTVENVRGWDIKRPASPVSTAAPQPDPDAITLAYNEPDVAADQPQFVINGAPFDPEITNKPQQILHEGHVNDWALWSLEGAHIHHIHINSFLISGRTVLSGKTQQQIQETGQNTRQPMAQYEMNIWRDTVYFDGQTTGDGQQSGDQTHRSTIVFAKSWQVDFHGEFVMHCHNLFHEDSGMMWTVSIEPAT
jgi:FtsP/CotA-like multicopper oxidase with cupredoxin domain